MEEVVVFRGGSGERLVEAVDSERWQRCLDMTVNGGCGSGDWR